MVSYAAKITTVAPCNEISIWILFHKQSNYEEVKSIDRILIISSKTDIVILLI